jgi:outer membrane usher protein
MLRTACHLLGALCVLLTGTAAAEVGTARDVWVEVRINDIPHPDFALLHVDLRGHLLVRAADVKAWHLRPQASADGLVRIDDIPGLRAHLEEDGLVLHLEAAPELFAAQVIASARRAGVPEGGVSALFLDYNLFAERNAGQGETYSGFVQGGWSLGRTSFTSSWLGSRSAGAGVEGASGWHRLDTDLLFDFPEYTARLTLGDGVASPGTLGQAVRFTGIHWATDYATQPGVTPYALPVVSGTAAVPSSVELYVNQALVQRTMVDAGPFELNNIPVPVGQGAVDIRMRDILGHEQQLSVPYLVIPQLLAPGLTRFDFAAGAVREDYGIASFAYGRSFLSGAVQHGLNEFATLSASGELALDSSEVTARGGAAVRATHNLTLELTPAVSHSAGMGSGSAVDAGIDSLWPSAAAGVHFRAASPGFVELGALQPSGRLHTELAVQASAQLGLHGSLGVLYASRRMYGAATSAATTLTYNVSFRRIGSVGAFVSNAGIGNVSDVIAGITFTRYFGRGVTGSATGTSDNGAATLNLQVGQATAPDAGWGWELAHARGASSTDGARVDVRSAYGTGSGELDAVPTGTIGIANWQGGLVWVGGRAWPAQTLAGPAALMEVPDLGGVQVLHDGQPVGRTDPAGRILVPGLRPFEDNIITIVPEDVPLTALVESERVVVRPYSHGVVRAAVAASESRVFVLRLDGAAAGALVPAGAEVVVGGSSFPVGAEGLAQLPVSHVATEAVVSWSGGRCRVRVPGEAKVVAAAGPVELGCMRVR